MARRSRFGHSETVHIGGVPPRIHRQGRSIGGDTAPVEEADAIAAELAKAIKDDEAAQVDCVAAANDVTLADALFAESDALAKETPVKVPSRRRKGKK